MRSERGFTLLEFLIAAGIFAMISMAAFSLLSQIQGSDTISQEKGEELHQLQRAFTIMERDFMQIVQRQVRLNEEAPTNQWLRGEAGMLDSEGAGVAFIHGGWRNPAARLPRSELQGVGYRLREGRLERLTTLYPDVADGATPRELTLLDGVDEFNLRFFANGQWQEQWTGEGLPKAVEAKVKTKAFGELTRLFLLPEVAAGGTLAGTPSSSGGTSSGSGESNSGQSGSDQNGGQSDNSDGNSGDGGNER